MKTITEIVCHGVVGALFALGCTAEVGDDLDVDGELDEQHVSSSCSRGSDCSGGLTCVSGACRPCTAHGQCDSDVCNLEGHTAMGLGACLREPGVVYVDDNRPDCQTGDGSRARPLCQIRDAIPRTTLFRPAVRVYPGRYLPFIINSRMAQVFGPRDGSAVAGEEDIGAAVRVTGGSFVLLDGLDFGVSVRNGVSCDSSTLRVLRASAHGDLRGIISVNCTFTMDRMRVGGLSHAAIEIAGNAPYSITNSYFRGGDAPAVLFTGASSGTFRFNTVNGGGEISPGGIGCGAHPRAIQDSIVFGNFAAAGGAQTVGACSHERVVVGRLDTRSDRGLIQLDPELDPEGRLVDSAANAACCIDRGAPGMAHDFFGTRRPQGPSTDVGAHELAR